LPEILHLFLNFTHFGRVVAGPQTCGHELAILKALRSCSFPSVINATFVAVVVVSAAKISLHMHAE